MPNVNIPTGATGLSDVLNVSGARVAAIIMPSSWTTGNLTFQGSYDGVTFFDIYDEAGAEYSITAAASRYIALDAGALELSGVPYLKVRSGTTATPVNQAAARVLQLVIS